MSKKRKRRLGDSNDPYIKAVKHCQKKFTLDRRALYACESGVDFLYDSQRGLSLDGRKRRR